MDVYDYKEMVWYWLKEYYYSCCLLKSYFVEEYHSILYVEVRLADVKHPELLFDQVHVEAVEVEVSLVCLLVVVERRRMVVKVVVVVAAVKDEQRLVQLCDDCLLMVVHK